MVKQARRDSLSLHFIKLKLLPGIDQHQRKILYLFGDIDYGMAGFAAPELNVPLQRSPRNVFADANATPEDLTEKTCILRHIEKEPPPAHVRGVAFEKNAST